MEKKTGETSRKSEGYKEGLWLGDHHSEDRRD